MREIKFRAWDKDRMVKGFELFEDNSAYRGAIPMQFTGLLDKNGKEIYEGDLLHNSMDKEPFYIIQWDSRNACFELGDDGNNLAKFAVHEFWEVIGNIYKNPELIKAVEEKE